MTDDPYQSRGFARIDFETETPHLRIEGNWPDDLAGTFYRIGPNPQFPPRGRYNPLLGDGMVHAFTMREGRVGYRNRWVRTRQWRLEHAAGRALFATSGVPGDSDPSVTGQATDGVANTNLIEHAGRLLALEEAHAPIEIDARSLATRGLYTFDGGLPGNMTAHPKRDPASGELLFFANFQNRRFDATTYLYVADRHGRIECSISIDGPFPALMHDFAVSRDFVVLLYCGVTVSLERARRGGPPLAWEAGRTTRLGVVRRTGTADVRWFDAPPCMVWHTVNAFNDGERVTIDVCQQDRPMFAAVDGTPPDPRHAGQYLSRWRIDCTRSTDVAVERLYADECEYPRIDERFAGRNCRYAWVACLGGAGTEDVFHRGIGCFDHATGSMQVFAAGQHCAVAEPVFVPRPSGTAEGDGYLLTNIYDEVREVSHLAAFDARAIAQGPIARAHLEHRMPVGFHGYWHGAVSHG
jgi:carotenoid cleavage dioxygenase-like enzyme